MAIQKTEYIGLRVEKEVRDILEKNVVQPDGNISDLVRNILREWTKKKSKNNAK